MSSSVACRYFKYVYPIVYRYIFLDVYMCTLVTSDAYLYHIYMIVEVEIVQVVVTGVGNVNAVAAVRLCCSKSAVEAIHLCGAYDGIVRGTGALPDVFGHVFIADQQSFGLDIAVSIY